VAPPSWNGEFEPTIPWCSVTSANIETALEIGTGDNNTKSIISKCTDQGAEASSAAKVASSYRGGNKADWYLPSKNELQLMFQNKNLLGKIMGIAQYWSSSQDKSLKSWAIDMETGLFTTDENFIDRTVRPIRAFG